jgi:hypothetical protein
MKELAGLLLKKLGECELEWLLVFDDVPESVAGAAAFQHLFFEKPLSCWGSGRIFFTTRSTAYGGEICLGIVTPIPLSELSDSDAVQMLLRFLLDSTSADAANAAETLVTSYFDGLPLAIATASAEIIHRETTIVTYLKKLNLDGVHTKVGAVLASALEHARDNGLTEILDIAAFVNPDRMQLILLGGDDDAVNLLCKLNLLRRVDEDTFSIHRLHQEAARGKRPCGTSIEASVKKLIDTFNPEADVYGNASLAIPHIGTLARTVLYHPLCETHDIDDIEALVKLGNDMLMNVGMTCKTWPWYAKVWFYAPRHTYQAVREARQGAGI